ncbi:DUF6402 family protein [Herbaspirillum rubrisubalbicans]|uniref:DUF6402 family protein n=1 Tax=Herbaspirillum rubrisubalbicans TaxID=80842 RepID=UPI0015C57982|nr:DUF6402 family protein [Herbaspirillum rubrisubalbicans]NQE47959.1 hypothetical protein [Herbaspirillum rubrisubalbicans]
MAKVRKLPYYQMSRARLPFTNSKWKCYQGFEGCVAINTLQGISYDRPAPGVVSPSPKPPTAKPIVEHQKGRQAEAVQQKLPGQAKKPQPEQVSKQQSKELDAEDREKLPEFDLQDIPGAMDHIGWPMSAKIARRWFNGPAHVWDDDLNSVQPLDDKLITLDWALRYSGVKRRLNELLEIIGSVNAQAVLKKKILQYAANTFNNTTSFSPNLDLDTAVFITDLRKFHVDWHFQKTEVSILDTTEGILVLTDLSGALGNFVLYAAIGRVRVTGARYFKYDTSPQQFCQDASASVTHIYIYIKDNYSFNDKDPSKSQYLGHWNKRNMIMSYYLAGNDIAGQFEPALRRQNENNNELMKQSHLKLDYFSGQDVVDKPVDARRGLFRKFIETDVYWPVYNRSYNEWREKHNRGEDFMIYSKPQLYKLKNPIIIDLGTLCRPYDTTSKNQ